MKHKPVFVDEREEWLYPGRWVIILFVWAPLVLIGLVLVVAFLTGCAGMEPAPDRPSQRTRGYNVPLCEVAPPGVQCRHNVKTRVSACEKRFGKKLCEAKKEEITP